ncbi:MULTISPECIES: single-stranded DNA-binding protein [Salimicrobium]|uniref:Single-stranded DNA-binding protein n=3 Tax=Salimicrobium TaxID=351195 RepID=K2GAY2_9BACI|nr:MULTISPECIES: single-stranded DNA-binding protein [Salimicrobium]AKG03346.1 single-stranded DNA-binding protein [Salimicrobium jeotgali]EKE31507.1 single-strand binding protein [Salimicrobium jeotgali]MBM7696704.1 single-strand DNA-binding protein [Salimicrobium jeotgali]SDY30773.1 single-strand DNA-binding protein [Salimicrobium album]SIS92088.1 single-strand binding protein [Salimicrobium salexigens]
MLNRVVLVGRLTKDPDLRYTPNGVAVANFTIAVNRPFSNNQGNNDADFINCVVWRRAAENLANFMSKGSQVGVDGRLQTRSFDNKEGRRVFVTEVVADSVQFLESKGSSGGGQSSRSDQSSGYQGNQNQPSQGNYGQSKNDDPFADDGEPIDISDDDLPF